MAKSKGRAVLVCTEYRGVFYGTTADPLDAVTATLTGVRCALYWDTATGGFLGLAATGPTKDCRISAKAEGPIVLQKVTCMAEISPAAAKAWESVKAVS